MLYGLRPQANSKPLTQVESKPKPGLSAKDEPVILNRFIVQNCLYIDIKDKLKSAVPLFLLTEYRAGMSNVPGWTSRVT